MEIILNSNENKINDNCLRYNFKQPIRFINQNISLTNMIFYNFFPNIDEKFKLKVKYTNHHFYLFHLPLIQFYNQIYQDLCVLKTTQLGKQLKPLF